MRINSAVTEASERFFGCLVEDADEGWCNFRGSEELYLGLRLGETIHDPPVQLAVAFLQTLVHLLKNQVVRDLLPILLCLLHHHLDTGVLLLVILHQRLGRDTHQAESVGDDLGLGCSAGAWRSQKEHLWWASGGTVAEPDSEHAGQVISDILLLLVVAVVEVDKLTEGSVHFSLVDVPLAVQGLGDLLKFLSVELLVNLSAILTDTSKTHSFVDAQVDELVGHDAQLLQRKGLDPGSWEPFDNPADASLLGLRNFSVDNIDNDIIVDVLE